MKFRKAYRGGVFGGFDRNKPSIPGSCGTLQNNGGPEIACCEWYSTEAAPRPGGAKIAIINAISDLAMSVSRRIVPQKMNENLP